MPFPPTPSQTASNTPTPSITASNTPTQTPSGSACIGTSPTPTPSITATPSITPSATPCPCVCGAEVVNNNAFEITYTYVNCSDITFSGTIAGTATLVLPCTEGSEIYVKYGSITTSATATITYGECITPPTPTPTPTFTSTPTETPTNTPTLTQTPTQTQSPTPTGEAPLQDFYLADEYDCTTCTISATNVVVGFATGTSVTIGNFYNDALVTGFVYEIISATTGPALTTCILPGQPSCAAACSV